MSNVRFFVLTQTCVKAGKLPVTPAAPKDPLGWANNGKHAGSKFKAAKIYGNTYSTRIQCLVSLVAY